MNLLFNLYNFHEEWAFDRIKHIIKPWMKVAIIPFSFQYERIKNPQEWEQAYGRLSGKYYDEIVIPFQTYGIPDENISWINYFIHTPLSAKEIIAYSDVLFFTGGLPDAMFERLKEFDLVQTIKKHPGIIIGCSAGAMIQLSEYYISPDEDYVDFCYRKGLGLLDGFGIECHYENTKVQNQCIQRFQRERQKPVYAMDNQSGLLIELGNIESLGKVTLFDV